MKSTKTFLTIDGQQVPVRVYVEHRKNVRASITKTGLNFRMPARLPKKEQEKHWAWFKKWATEQFQKQPKVKGQFVGKAYKNGDTITVYERTYTLKILYEERKSHTAKILKNKTIQLKLAKGDQPYHLQKSIQQLLSRVIANDCLPSIEHRIDEINDRYFHETINGVRLKYNQSNWGSCSSERNINLSTRLLFAPKSVIDYVIVHELAHLKEMNHSPRFWKIVSNVMPNYQEKEQWLKKNGHLCRF